MLIKKPARFDKSPAAFDALTQIFEAVVLKFFDVQITGVQRRIAREIIYRVLMRKRHTIVISACRQIGKTEIVCYVIWFLSYVFTLLENEKFKAVLTAPEKSTGSEVFDRTKNLYDKCENDRGEDFKFKQKNLDAIVLHDNSRIDVFGLFKGFARREDKKTTKEGRTYHVAVRDEMHLGHDDIFTDEIEPALSTTGGVDIWLGNGGWRQCRAKELCETKDRDDVTTFILDFLVMKEEMQKEYELTGNEMFLRWIDSQLKFIEDNGENDDLVLKNLFLKWLVEVGNFVDFNEFITHRRDEEPTTTAATRIADAGADFGKESDETIVTITDYERNVREWATFYGEYPDQVDEIAAYLPEAARRLGVSIRNLFCDSTGVGDPITSMLKRKLRIPVHGIVFSSQNKDKLAKKAIKALNAKAENERLTYPTKPKEVKKFEEQMKHLQKERKGAAALIAYHHPAAGDVKDDYADSLFLSLWNMEKINQVKVYAKNTIG